MQNVKYHENVKKKMNANKNANITVYLENNIKWTAF